MPNNLTGENRPLTAESTMRLRLLAVPYCLRPIQLTALAALIVLFSSAPTSAQLTVETAPPATYESEDVPFGEYAPPSEGEPHYSSMADSGYWFLSTNNCPQSFDHTCPQFCPIVLRREQCDDFRRSSLAELSGGLEPGVPVCIVIHGSFVDTPSACHESGFVWNWLRSASCGNRMQMVYFSWPSFKPLSIFAANDVNILGRQAARNGYYLAELIQHIPPECPICILGHSHGTRVASAGLHLMAGGRIQGICHPFARANGRQIRTVFAAAAVDHNWLNPGKRYDRALRSTECILNLTNCKDPALAVYPLRMPLFVKRPIGSTGLTGWDRRQLGRMGTKIRDYDVSRAVGASHLWPYYFRNNDLAMAMRNYVYFPDRNTAATN